MHQDPYNMLRSLDQSYLMPSIGFAKSCIDPPRCFGQLSSASFNNRKATSIGVHTNTRLVTFSDAGWALDGDDCCSQHGYAIYYGNNLIIWASMKQHVVAKLS
ncbi:hypothetical protein V2J09_004160 [Rumex salicifolius]